MKFCSECAHPVQLIIPNDDNRLRYVCGGCGTIHYQNPKMIVGSIPVWEQNGKTQILSYQLDGENFDYLDKVFYYPSVYKDYSKDSTSAKKIKEMIEKNKIKRVMTEREILAASQHPFIVALHWCWTSKNNIYFVMDWY